MWSGDRGAMDKLSPEQRHRCMQRIKCRDTTPELIVRKALRENGYSGYRLQWKVPGRPDIAYPGKKVAIFINGCFWHRCPICNPPIPATNTDFWIAKFSDNVSRDQRKHEQLAESGWTVIVIWECEIKKDLNNVVDWIANALE